MKPRRALKVPKKDSPQRPQRTQKKGNILSFFCVLCGLCGEILKVMDETGCRRGI
jgi:hypothetical protein